MTSQRYQIYAHADADGGIAAAIFSRFIAQQIHPNQIEIEVHPVNHGPDQQDWCLTEIKYPCAILDFSLHPAFLTEKFFSGTSDSLLKGKNNVGCYWIDHHPTGAGIPFITPENCQSMLSNVTSLWDVEATSTPGLMRKHQKQLRLPSSLIEEYEELIDLAEIIDAALFADAEAAHDFSSDSVKLQTLFSATHPAIDRTRLYRALVTQLTRSPSVSDLMGSDPIYQAVVEYEKSLVAEQKRIYAKTTKLNGKVAITDFTQWNPQNSFAGMGRFIPYLLNPDILYAIHILPPKNGISSISCGINPWNKPKKFEKHLGNYFATHFGGGGHAFVAGGRLSTRETKKIDELVSFLQN
jgi:hypothetical protein